MPWPEAARIVAARRATGGENLGHALQKLGRARQEAGDNRTAMAVFRETADVYRAAFGKPTDFLAQALYNQGVATRDAGDPSAAIAPLQEALAIDIENWGVDHRHVLADRSNLARTLLAAGRPAEALEQARAALASPATRDLERARVLGYRLLEGQALLALRHDREAEQSLVEVVAGFDALGSSGDRSARRAREALVQLYERQGRAAEAKRIRDRDR